MIGAKNSETPLKMDAGKQLALFRMEAIEAYSDVLGSPFPRTGFRARTVIFLVAGFLGVLGAFLACGSYSRKETVSGRIIPASGLSAVVCSKQGVITRVWLKEGDPVRKGQPIATISVESTLSNGLGFVEQVGPAILAQSQAKVDQIESTLQRTRSDKLVMEKKFLIFRSQASHLEREISLQTETVKSLHRTVSDLKPILEKRYIAVIQYRQYVTQSLSEAQKVSSLESIGNSNALLGQSAR